MIKFYRMQDCSQCGAIQEALEDLGIAHKTFVLSSSGDLPPDLGKSAGLPLLVDDGEVIHGSENILSRFEELAAFKKRWYEFETDACYCDEEE